MEVNTDPSSQEFGSNEAKGQESDGESHILSLLLSLPREILFWEIFTRLDLKTIASVSRVCKSWHKVTQVDYFWEKCAKQRWRSDFFPSKSRAENKATTSSKRRTIPVPYVKPKCKNWKWVVQSKLPLPNPEGFTGVAASIHDEQRSRYEGEWKDGKPDGYGITIWSEGDKYEGEFKDGFNTGYGVFTWARVEGEENSERYEGEFFQGKVSGKGTYYWSNGNIYVGDFLDEKKHGKGKITCTFFVYEGDFRNDEMHGQGSIVWTRGDSYIGDFFHGKRSGDGTYFWLDGTKYEGSFLDDAMHGRGKLTWANGNTFEGEYVNDYREGRGIFREHISGHIIDGIWVKNAPVEGTGAFNPLIQEAIKKNHCTYTVTEQNRYGQFFYVTDVTDTRPHGYCVVCAEHCAPRNNIIFQDSTPKFGGNFFCDCGFGYNPKLKCYAMD